MFEFKGMHDIDLRSRSASMSWGIPQRSVYSHLNVLDRFVARRGKPKRIRSDQGPMFIGGAKEHQELTKVLAEKNSQGQLAEEVKKRWGIKFVFNVEYTPHHGGRWERMVKEFKRIVANSVVSIARMTYNVFARLLIRAEGIINQHPIAINDDLRVITPLQLLRPASAAAFASKWVSLFPASTPRSASWSSTSGNSGGRTT
jgi:hypothetical protein